MLIDTHCHLDATEFDADRDAVASRAKRDGVACIIVPAVTRENFDAVIHLANRYDHCCYALGIHPMYVQRAVEDDLNVLRNYVQQYQPVAIGEIGLDFFTVNPRNDHDSVARQIHFFTEQLKIAKENDLPVILHVRQAVDEVLKHLRRLNVCGGIAHAFNGSLQQAEQFISLGFKLGFGGAMTYERARKIRELAVRLPLDAIVLETDAPDIPPEWVGKSGRNSPSELPRIAQILADLRQDNTAQVVDITGLNAVNALPKLADLCTRVKVAL